MEDITWFNGQYWLFLCETEPKLPVYHIMSFDENDKVTNDFVIRNEFGDSISLCRMILGSRLYLTAYDFSTQKDYLYPVDEKDGSVSPDNKIDLTKNLSANESFHSCAFVGDDLAILSNSDHPRVELIDPAGGTLKKQVSLEALSRDHTIVDDGWGETAMLVALQHPQQQYIVQLADEDRTTVARHAIEGLVQNLTVKT